MIGEYLCQVCLVANGVETRSNEENQDLLVKLRVVGAISIIEKDHLPQLICQTCSIELQLAYDFISQYEATYNKLRTVPLYDENAKESSSIASAREQRQKTQVETIQEDVQAGNNLVAEIVVKEEILSDDEQRLETDCNKNTHEYKTCVVDARNTEDDGNTKRLPLRTKNDRDGESCQHKENSNALLEDMLSIMDTIVKEEAKLADESFDEIENSKQNEGSSAATLSLEAGQNMNTKMIQEKVTADNTLIAEIFVKEEMFLDDDQHLETGCNKDAHKYRTWVVDASHKMNDLKMSGLYSADSESDGNYSERLPLRIRNDKDGEACHGGKISNTISDDMLSLKGQIKDVVKVKEKLTGEDLDETESSKQNERCNAATPKLLKDVSEATTSRDGDCGGPEKRINERDIGNVRFADDIPAQKKLPFAYGTSCMKHVQVSNHQVKMQEHQTKTINPNRAQTNECTKSFMCLKGLEINIQQENAILTHDFGLDETTSLFNQYFSDNFALKQHASPVLKTHNQCDESVLNSQQIQKIQKGHASPDSFENEECSQIFSYKQQLNLQQQLKIHVNPVDFECEQCGKIFTRQISLKQHQKRHLNPDAFKCEVCDKRFSSDLLFRRHKITHSNPGLTCLECGKWFANERSVSEHQMLHLNPDAFKCDQCDKKFSSSNCLGQHKRAHLNPESVTCDECGISFTYVKFLKLHKMLHSNPDAFKCEYCCKRYSSNLSLKQHKTTHLNEFFACEKCEKIFKTEYSMKEHEMLHLNPDAFKCTHCDKRYASRKQLSHHKVAHLNPELVTCNQCEKSFATEYLMNEHQKLHSNPDAFKCEHCNKKYSSRKKLEQHKIAHLNPALVTCDRCGKSFASERSMEEHKKLHLNPDTFKCELCNKRYSSGKKLEQHKVVHLNSKLVTCNQCGKTFANQHIMNNHRMLHSNPDAFKCEQCEKRCSSKQMLVRHKLTHSNPESLTCEQCKKTFSSMHLMDEHRTMHLNPDAFKCEKCDKRFSNKHSLRQHRVTHTNPELLTCDQCEKSFPYLRLLKQHQILHSNPDAFKCEHCDKKFPFKSRLAQHKIKHSNPEMLACKQCEKSFEYVYLLKEHQILHSNPDAFKCEVCDKRCTSKKNLIVHKKTHSNSKLFTCDEGGKSMARGPTTKHQEKFDEVKS